MFWHMSSYSFVFELPNLSLQSQNVTYPWLKLMIFWEAFHMLRSSSWKCFLCGMCSIKKGCRLVYIDSVAMVTHPWFWETVFCIAVLVNKCHLQHGQVKAFSSSWTDLRFVNKKNGLHTIIFLNMIKLEINFDDDNKVPEVGMSCRKYDNSSKDTENTFHTRNQSRKQYEDNKGIFVVLDQ